MRIKIAVCWNRMAKRGEAVRDLVSQGKQEAVAVHGKRRAALSHGLQTVHNLLLPGCLAQSRHTGPATT